MKKLAILLTFSLCISAVWAQDLEAESQFKNTPFNLGLGVGLDYGGIVGAKATYIIANRIGVFAGLGYNLNGAGYNLGTSVRFAPDKKVTPYITLMYGYNAVINVTGDFEFQKTYYGATTGFGIELKSRSNANFWNFELLLPFRDPAYQEELDALKDSGVTFAFEPLPITFSVGYHFGLK